MTAVDKSPEQLDAEAAAPASGEAGVPLEERDIKAAIATHRALYRADLGILRLHVRDGESGLGPPFSPAFEHFLDQLYGQVFPWSKALLALRNHCRLDHRPKHVDRPEWRGSLCHALVTLVIRQEYSVDMARLQLGLPDAGKSKRTLDNALLFIERRLEDMAQQQDQAQKATVSRSPAEWMAPAHEHRALPGLHAEECEQCRRRSAA